MITIIMIVIASTLIHLYIHIQLYFNISRHRWNSISYVQYFSSVIRNVQKTTIYIRFKVVFIFILCSCTWVMMFQSPCKSIQEFTTRGRNNRPYILYGRIAEIWITWCSRLPFFSHSVFMTYHDILKKYWSS